MHVPQAQLNDEYETLEDTELDFATKARPDENLGHHSLSKPRYRDEAPVVPAYSAEADFVVEILNRSRLLHISAVTRDERTSSASNHPSDPTTPIANIPGDAFHKQDDYFSTTKLFADRASYQADTLQFLEVLLTLSSPLFPRPAIFLDYVPWVTIMVRSDDEEELNERTLFQNLQIAGNGNGAGRLRMTRNSTKGTLFPGGSAPLRRWPSGGNFVRYLDMLNKDQLKLARKTALTWSD